MAILLIIGAAAVLAAAMWSLVLALEWTHVFRPLRKLPAEPSDVGLDFEEVEFTSEDGKRLHGWWVPAAGATATVLFCHGNGGNIGSRVDTLRILHEFGVNVFAFDYRGYGRSRGIPSEHGTRKDALAAYEVVRARYHDTEAPPVIVYGRSLGGAIAMQLASEQPTLGVVVESAFSSMLDMAAHLYPFVPYRWLGRYRFDTARAAASVLAPKLIAHSTEDELIPITMSEGIFAAAAEPKQYYELRGGHSEAGWVSNPAYHEVLETFIRSAAEGTPVAPRQ
jgi:fermentation-respiration switch protein FrsA (DUF1100 family)